MKWLLFLSRLALICNVLFLLCLVLQRTDELIKNIEWRGTVIVLGWLLAPFINFSANVWYFIKRMSKQQLNFPVWLAVTNFLFMLLQFFVHFILA